jgi:hypothetical protein
MKIYKSGPKVWTLDFGLETFVGLLLLLFKQLDSKNQTLGFHFFGGIYFPSNSTIEKGGDYSLVVYGLLFFFSFF